MAMSESADNQNEAQGNTTNATSTKSDIHTVINTLVVRCVKLVNTLKYCVRKDNSCDNMSPKLSVLKSALLVYMVVFLFSIIVNKTTFHGRCVGRVDYASTLFMGPTYSPLGYSACENNTDTAAENITYHSASGDNGYPSLRVIETEALYDRNGGPSWRTLNMLGSVDTNYIRLYGEWFRIVTAITLHANWWHLLNNMLAHFFLFYIVEPEWGLYRTVIGYFVTGCGGYLVGAVFVPCLQQVGASGVQLGFMGALIPYCVEHWYRMGSPELILILGFLLVLIDFAASDKTISVHIHLGGYLFGILYGFASIKSVALFDRGTLFQRVMMKCFSRWLNQKTRDTYTRNMVRASQGEEVSRMQYEKNAKANELRARVFKYCFGIYPMGPYRMRCRDIITRMVSCSIIIVLLTILIFALYNEAMYTGIISEATGLFSSTCKCCYIKQHPRNALQATHTKFLQGKYFCFRSKEYSDLFCQ